jgi:hypothetical protein
MPHSFSFWMQWFWVSISAVLFIVVILNHIFLFGFKKPVSLLLVIFVAFALMSVGWISIPLLINLYMA